MNSMSSSSSAKSRSVMSISDLPLPLSCTVNTESVPITENIESVFEKNNRLRVQIGLPQLAQPETTLNNQPETRGLRNKLIYSAVSCYIPFYMSNFTFFLNLINTLLLIKTNAIKHIHTFIQSTFHKVSFSFF